MRVSDAKSMTDMENTQINKRRIRRLLEERMFSVLKEEAERQNVEIDEYTQSPIIDIIDIDRTTQGRDWWMFINRVYAARFERDCILEKLRDEICRIDNLISYINKSDRYYREWLESEAFKCGRERVRQTMNTKKNDIRE